MYRGVPVLVPNGTSSCSRVVIYQYSDKISYSRSDFCSLQSIVPGVHSKGRQLRESAAPLNRCSQLECLVSSSCEADANVLPWNATKFRLKYNATCTP